MVRNAAFISLLVLAACARTEEASLVAPESDLGYNAVETVRTPEQDDSDVALGEWRDSLQEEQRALEFGPIGAAPLFSLRCDQRRSILLQRHGAVPVGDLPMMLVTVGNETRRLAVTPAGGPIPMLRSAVAPSDPLMASLGAAEGEITIRVGDGVPLVMPADQAVGEFVRECAAPGAAAPAAPAAEPAEPAPSG